MKVKIKKLNPNAVTPTYATDGSAGIDICVTSHDVDENGCDVYGTGIAVEIPKGYVGLVFPRSSIAKKRTRLTNCVGVIDSDYRGEIMAKFKPDVITMNPLKVWLSWFSPIKRFFKKCESDVVYVHDDSNSYMIGEKTIQLIIVRIPRIEWEEVDELSQTGRGDGGFGHTGE